MLKHNFRIFNTLSLIILSTILMSSCSNISKENTSKEIISKQITPIESNKEKIITEEEWENIDPNNIDDDDPSTFAWLDWVVARGKTLQGTQAVDFTLKDEKGQSHSLSDFRGKYVLLDFWGTSCGPCIAKFPEMKKVYKNLDKDKFEFINICRDCDDFVEFLEEKPLEWLQLQMTMSNKINYHYGVGYVPVFILIGPEGKILLTDHDHEKNYYKFKDLQKLVDSYVK